MDFLEELSDPSSPVRGVLIVVILLAILLTLVAVGIAGYLDYRILHPVSTSNTLSTEDMRGHPSSVPYTVPGEGGREGWFFPGLRSAPVVVLCHGYRSQRGDVLTLATTLQENQYNVFVFDFSGHGKSPGSTTLGPRESTEVLTAVALMAQRNDVDKTRIGLWGTNMGAHAALAAAAADRRVAAIVVDSVYDDPQEFFGVELEHSGYGGLPVVSWMCRVGFRVEQLPYRGQPPLATRLPALARIPKLFIALRDNTPLAASTLRLYNMSPEPREQWVMAQSSYLLMSNEEKKAYDNNVLSFFLRSMPPTAAPIHTR
jgi:pimeloyl-ACP methyl ester carboxylesterase